MKRFRILLTALAVILSVSLALSACGGGGDGSGTDKDGNTLIKIMFHVDKQSAEGLAYKKRVDDFNVYYKDQKIKAVPEFYARSTSATSYETTLSNLKTDGNLPDIITFDAPNTASYAKSKILYSIDNLISAETKNDFFEISKNTYNGKLYGLPIQESSAGIYYNKNIFSAAGVNVSAYTVENPWTFDQFKEVCQRLKDSGKCELAIDLRLNATVDETATYLLYPFIYAAGGKFLSDDGLTATGYLNSAKTVAGFQFIKDIEAAGYTTYSPNDTNFFTGKYAMYLSSGWTIPDLDNKYPDVFPDRNSWGVLPYPKSEAKASATGSWSFGMTDNGKDNKDKAKLLLEWMVSLESSKGITAATGMIPARKSIYTDDAGELKVTYAAGSPELVLYQQLSTSGTARPVTIGYPNFTSAFADIIKGMKNDSNVSGVCNTIATNLQTELNRLK